MKIKSKNLLCTLLIISCMLVGTTDAVSAMKRSICNDKIGNSESFQTDKSFKCFKCGKWFDYECLNGFFIMFGGKPRPQEYICLSCSGLPDDMPYDELGFNKDGVHKDTGRKWDSDGYDVNGFNKRGIHKMTGTKFNPQGFDQNGCDINGKPVLKKNMYRFVGILDYQI